MARMDIKEEVDMSRFNKVKMNKSEKRIVIAWVFLVVFFIIGGPAIQHDNYTLFFVGLPFFIIAFVILFKNYE